MRSVPRLCEFNPGICLKTEEKHGKTSVRVVNECCYPPYPHPEYYISLTHPYSTKPTHTHPHTLQYKHTITIPTISPPTFLHKPHTSVQYKTHTYTPLHITSVPPWDSEIRVIYCFYINYLLNQTIKKKTLQNKTKFRTIPTVLIWGQLKKLIQSSKICIIYGLFSETDR